MLLIEHPKSSKPTQPFLNRPADAPGLPPQAEMILSAIETGQYGRLERRCVARAEYRVKAMLKLFSDVAGTPPWTLYTRDANARGLGFISTHRLPLGYGGVLDIMAPDGQTRAIPCTLLRCREAAPGWYEGALYFNRAQMEFAV